MADPGQGRGSPTQGLQPMIDMLQQLLEQIRTSQANRDADREAVQSQIRVLQLAVGTPTPTP